MASVSEKLEPLTQESEFHLVTSLHVHVRLQTYIHALIFVLLIIVYISSCMSKP